MALRRGRAPDRLHPLATRCKSTCPFVFLVFDFDLPSMNKVTTVLVRVEAVLPAALCGEVTAEAGEESGEPVPRHHALPELLRTYAVP